jgi:hypothetical protein
MTFGCTPFCVGTIAGRVFCRSGLQYLPSMDERSAKQEACVMHANALMTNHDRLLVTLFV